MRCKLILLFFSVAVLASIPLIMAIQPTGGAVTEERSETAPADAAGTMNAQAGNVTELNIFGYSVTQTWQGYFGNITGTIQLADSGDNVLYNWSLADPQGEIYASTNGSITWDNIQCFNFTADGSYTGESGNGGTTSLYGTNLTTLESQFNIASGDVDGVDETFTLSGAGTHDLFYTANQEFSEGECRSTRIYGDTGAGVNDEFEEVLLYEPATSSVIFTSLIEPGNMLGFDNKDYDFEMLVLEDGRGTDTSVTPYYFFVELE
ncbi:hypothetical protein BMS3Abin17_00817 [archaeon BMS3Abin17]|nr:hypothetical protein BMS3Abin17_00817 [archaeon BMS3Abin17]HDZ60089.1 hypothetical protein [Candidatus Pacearchaeota archaeon]